MLWGSHNRELGCPALCVASMLPACLQIVLPVSLQPPALDEHNLHLSYISPNMLSALICETQWQVMTLNIHFIVCSNCILHVHNEEDHVIRYCYVTKR